MTSSMMGNQGYSSRTGEKEFKAPSGYKKFSQFTPEQMQLFKQLFSNVSPDSFLSRLAGGDQNLFDQMEAPALSQFSGLQGNLASRFSGMGMGARRSSGFQNTSNQAASDFAQQLQSNRMALQRQAISDLMGLSENLLQQKPYGLVRKESRGSSGWGGLIGAGLGGAAGLGLSGGNPMLGLQGAQLGYGIGSAF